nr:PREDICTED: probable ATP-dependent RNA helicase DDX10 [Bemisia tabaci]
MQDKKKKLQFYKKKKPLISEDDKIQRLTEAYNDIDVSKVTLFKDLPLSEYTKKGLSENKYYKMTEIQRQTIAFSLQGCDILGAAKTGSGKTLAFLIPALERLYCKKWSRDLDNVGILIITPTRELAYQIFETLRKVGVHHNFSAGLIIGGKDLKFERKRMDQCSIVICTPGRLLQHMDENPLFDCTNLQMLVLDEADRCLDLGFQQTLNSIIENLPPQRQTLLFSATQTTSVKDLARLSLKNPKFISVHEKEQHSTPEGLRQSYVVCELHDKLNMLWSFIKSHLKMKILIFMSSCKQVKYIYELFCRLRPGTSLLALYGSLHQMRRMKIYDEFHRKERVILFATDIAARGLDFPAVNWVVQMDCPENANEYIHRAGRTARFNKKGESLLVLLPSEKPFLEQLEQKKIPIKEIQINTNKMTSIQRSVEAALARDANLKETAQRAFVAYVKSVFLMKNKEVFNVHALDTNAYARSLGLAMPPRIRFLQRIKKESSDQSEEVKVECLLADARAKTEVESEDDSKAFSKADEFQLDSDVNKRKLRQDLTKEVYKFYDSGSESDEDFMSIKRRNHELEDEIEKLVPDPPSNDQSSKKKKPITKASLAKKILHKKIIPNKKIVFDDDGQVITNPARERVTEAGLEYEASNEGGLNIDQAVAVMKEEDLVDKKLFRDKIRAKRLKEKAKAKKAEVEEVDDFGESESDDGPDLSTLPDPDKLYGPKGDSDEDENSDYSNDDDDSDRKYPESGSSDEESNDSDDIHISAKDLEEFYGSQKRKLEAATSKNMKRRKKVDPNVEFEPMDTGLSLTEDEELALKFLRSKR